MDLFTINTPDKNWLPYDGVVNYYGVILPEPDEYFKILLNSIAWQQDQALIFGKHIFTRRMVSWYGDEAYDYSYSGIKKTALPWTDKLLELKALVEKETNETFNSCLLNLYHDGNDGMAWHSDGEKDLKVNGTIASISLGSARKFSFKHKQSKEKIDLILDHGSLLLMRETTQTHWLHRLPPTKKVKSARINLTFRTIVAKSLLAL